MSVLNFPHVRHSSRAEKCPVPAAAEALQTLPRVDYADAFAIDLLSGSHPDPRQLAGAVFDLRSAAVGGLLRLVCLGLGAQPVATGPDARAGAFRVGPRVWGMNIAGTTSDAVSLEMLTWAGLVQIVISVENGAESPRLVLTTFVAFGSALGRKAFSLVVGPAHRRVVPHLLAHAASNWS